MLRQSPNMEWVCEKKQNNVLKYFTMINDDEEKLLLFKKHTQMLLSYID